jgi:hypothetical protein
LDEARVLMAGLSELPQFKDPSLALQRLLDLAQRSKESKRCNVESFQSLQFKIG